MPTPTLRSLAPWGGALALWLGSAGVAPAQNGQAPTGPPVTNPGTTPNPTGRTPTPRTTGEILPPVPETNRDPAPPGTRGVRVDVPRTGPGTAPAPGGAAPAAAGQRRPANVLTAEGVVTRIDRAGKNLQGELERFAFDPSQDWYSFVNRGVTGIPEKDAERPKDNAAIKDANAKQHEESPDKPQVLEMVITKRSAGFVFTHARAEDGTDLYGVATASSPDTTNSRSGLTNRQPSAMPNRPMPTNFTNIREGSFVSVRYRKVGDLNEVLNLNLIELPLNPPGTVTSGATGGGASSVTGAVPTGAGTTGAGTTGVGTTGASRTTGTGTTGTVTAPAGVVPGTTGTGTSGALPGTTPAVPTAPAGAPSTPR